jgi:hypothetical protein
MAATATCATVAATRPAGRHVPLCAHHPSLREHHVEISTFELIFKPQSPAAPSGVAAVDRVIQGYFLCISNLEPRAYRYRLEFIVPPPPPGTPAGAFRTPAGNTLVFVDSGGSDNQQGVLSGAANQSRFVPSTGFVRVPAHGTALVAVLPSAFGATPLDPSPLGVPNFETRGYVRISLPAVRVGGGGFSSLFTVAQSKDPVRVLLTPQHRATFLRADSSISDQIQASLPLAHGAGIATLAPEPGGFSLSVADLETVRPDLGTIIDAIEPENRGLVLASLLGDLNAASADLEALNRALAAANVPLAVERRRPARAAADRAAATESVGAK